MQLRLGRLARSGAAIRAPRSLRLCSARRSARTCLHENIHAVLPHSARPPCACAFWHRPVPLVAGVGLRQHSSPREPKRLLGFESGYMPIYHRQFWDKYEQMEVWCERQQHEGWPSPELERWATLVKTALWQLAHTKPRSEFVLGLLAEYTDKLEAELNSAGQHVNG
jgi:hypothetical protein